MSDLNLMIAAFVLSIVAAATMFWKYRELSGYIRSKKQPRDSRGRFAKKDKGDA